MSSQSGEAESASSGNIKSEESRIRLLVIVLGSFILYFCSWGLAQSFGVLYIELRDKFGGTKSEAAWVQSLFSGILLASGNCFLVVVVVVFCCCLFFVVVVVFVFVVCFFLP